jgi:hypothetical protein
MSKEANASKGLLAHGIKGIIGLLSVASSIAIVGSIAALGFSIITKNTHDPECSKKQGKEQAQ